MFEDLKTQLRSSEFWVAWGCFFAIFAYFWPTENLFTHIAANGDALEVLWGIMWYNHALIEGVSPFHYPLVFHPEGWPVGILAHTPLLFLLAQPFYVIGGELFAYNMLAIAPFIIAYVGMRRFARHYTQSTLIIIAVSLAYAFVVTRSTRVSGHLHIFWATSFFPLLGSHILHWANCDEEEDRNLYKHIVFSGVYWGLSISFSLYSIFIAPVLFLLLQRRLLNFRRIIPQLFISGIVALAIGSTVIIPYILATRSQPVALLPFTHLVHWSTNVNSIFVIPRQHPFAFMRMLGNLLHEPSFNESTTINLGLTTLIIALFALYHQIKRKEHLYYGAFLVVCVGALFAMGPLLKYDNIVVNNSLFDGLNSQLWRLGHAIKPDVFISPVIPGEFSSGIPLPGYIMLLVIPFWEGARTTARFAFVALLGGMGLVTVGLDALPKWWRYLFLFVWLFEMAPAQLGNVAVDLSELHPAHLWLQTNAPLDQAVVDIGREGVTLGPETLYISWQTQRPTAGGIGSFRTRQNEHLNAEFNRLLAYAPRDLARLLHAYDITYVVLHMDFEPGKQAWEFIQNDETAFAPIGCFLPEDDFELPWAYEICLAQVQPLDQIVNLLPVYGLSSEEPWGMWAMDRSPRFNFVATKKTAQMVVLEAFPHCVDDLVQSMRLIADEEVLYDYVWNDCETIYAEILVPVENLDVGVNEIRFEIEYALSPAEAGVGADSRPLAIGFNQLKVQPLE